MFMFSVLSFGFEFDTDFYNEYISIFRKQGQGFLAESFIDKWEASVRVTGLPNLQDEVINQSLSRDEVVEFMKLQFTPENIQKHEELVDALVKDSMIIAENMTELSVPKGIVE